MQPISILGTGRMAMTLAHCWLAKGHSLTLGSRAPDHARARIGALADQVAVTDFASACHDAELVVLAVPYSAVATVLPACGDLAGKILVDTTNPWTPDSDQLASPVGSSAAEEIALLVPGANVVKALNAVFWKNLRDPVFSGLPASMFYCGDDDSAKSTVAALALHLGFDPVDCGPLTRARILESMSLLWARLAFEQGMGTDIAINLVRR